MRYYDLRHTYATNLLNLGVPIQVVKEYLGHGDIKTTAIYAHTTNAALRAAAEVLGEIGEGTKREAKADADEGVGEGAQSS